MNKPIGTLAVAGFTLIAGVACAQMRGETDDTRMRGEATTGAATTATTAELSQQDRTFAQKAAQGGAAEVEMAQLALERASSPEIKQLAERILQDHKNANQQLMQVAQENNLDLPKSPSPEQQKTIQELSRLSGSEFDQRYVQVQVKEHKKDIEMFRNETQQGQNQQLQTFASNTLPVLQEHLQMAQSIEDQIAAR